MTWEPGMIAVRVTTEGSTAFGKRVIPVGSRVVVKRFMARGELSLDFGRRGQNPMDTFQRPSAPSTTATFKVCGRSMGFRFLGRRRERNE
jgi:hypothetical protein